MRPAVAPFALMLAVMSAHTATAQPPASAGEELFERKIRPVLVEKCYGCHSSKLKSPMGGFTVDTKAGLSKGGSRGAEIVAGKPEESRLLHALTYTDNSLQMPPSGKLPEDVLAAVRQWIELGAPDPRKDAPVNSATPAPLKGMSIADGRQWWSFQPVKELPPPAVKNATWARTKVDAFILSKLEASKLKPSPEADKRTLAVRAYLDLVGVKPTYSEVQAFVSDPAPDAYEKLVDRLLASPHYGERWGRHWLDVARYAEDNSTSEATNPPFAFAWRYRDWVIEAMNKDVPYDKFVKLQLAADSIPETPRDDYRALGYLGVAPVYHKEPRLSQEVLYTFATDDWDERVDAVARGFLGLTVSCARCHDHKFDPIKQTDYQGLAGVFASTMRAERPLRADIDPKLETRYLWIQQRLFDMNVIMGILSTGEKQTNPEWAAKKLEGMKVEQQQLLAEIQTLKDRYPEMVAHVAKIGAKPGPPLTITPSPPAAETPGVETAAAATNLGATAPLVAPSVATPAAVTPLSTPGSATAEPPAAASVRAGSAIVASTSPSSTVPSVTAADKNVSATAPASISASSTAASPKAATATATPTSATLPPATPTTLPRRRGAAASDEPFMNAVYDAALYVDGKDPFMTEMDYRPGEARDLPLFKAGNVANPGDIVPRHFPTVLAKSEEESKFLQGSGRAELGDKIFSDAAPLSARVIVNRVWDWHFGKPLVGTPSDFGTQGDKPTHPELLDDLAARFIAHGWSLKWLHREIMLSAAYRQASAPRPDAEQVDSTNKLVWRMNPRRLDIEAYRDSIMHASGTLNDQLYGISIDFDDSTNDRRTIYARISRGRLNTVLRLYDFPDPMQSSPGRDLTTTPLQQLFVMNSTFIQKQAEAFVGLVDQEPDNAAKIRKLFEAILLREPSPKDVDRGLTYLDQATLAQYAQALLSVNEVIFWP